MALANVSKLDHDLERFPPEILARLASRMREGLVGHLSIGLVEAGPGHLTVQMQVGEIHMAANGYLHGGAVVTLADTACGYGCIANLPDGAISFTTIELKSNFMRTATRGVIRAQARLAHGGRRTQVWDATVVDAEERTLALFRCTQLLLYPEHGSGSDPKG